jgi:hypothetical protein
MDNTDGSHTCNICKKTYTSYKSLWNHNKKFHTEEQSITNHNQSLVQLQTNHNNSSTSCRYCNKIFSHYNNKWRHEKTCKDKNQIIIIDKNQYDDLQNKNKELEEKINKLESKINNNIQTNNITNNNNTTNNTINNVYVKFPNISYDKILSKKEILKILNKMCLSLEESIKTIHFNDKYPEYNNVYITNLRDNIGHVFNGNQFIAIDKNEMINDLIDSHIYEITTSIDKYKPKLNDKVLNTLENFIEKIEDMSTEFRDYNNNRKYTNYKSYKSNSISKILYNESSKSKLNQLKNLKLEEKLIETEDPDSLEI